MGNALNYEISARVKQYRKNLEELNDDALEAKLKQGCSYAIKKEGFRESSNPWNSMAIENVFYEGLAARAILSERHGEGYVLRLMGCREPVTLKEKMVYFFTGMLPWA